MSNWDFNRALAEYKHNEQKLTEITESLQDTAASLKRQGDRAECYLRMQDKIQKKLFKEEIKRLPSHFHSAAACVYTNHSTRDKLVMDFKRRRRGLREFQAQLQDLKTRNEHFISQSKTYLASAKDYVTWWKESLDPIKKKVPKPDTPNEPIPYHGPPYVHRSTKERERHRKTLAPHRGVKVNQMRISRETPTLPLRQLKLKRLDRMLSKEFNSAGPNTHCYDCNGNGQGRARAAEPDTFGIRFKHFNVPPKAKKGNCAKDNRKPSHNPRCNSVPRPAAPQYYERPGDRNHFQAENDFGWKDEAWSREYYEELEKLKETERLDAH